MTGESSSAPLRVALVQRGQQTAYLPAVCISQMLLTFQINGFPANQMSGIRCVVLQLICGRRVSRDSRRLRGFLSQSPGPLIGGARSPSASGRVQAETPTTGAESLRSALWIMLWSLSPRWSDVLVIVKPATLIAWHRRGFRLYWRWRSRRRIGRPRINQGIRSLLRQMSVENADRGAPKIHDKLLKLGFCGLRTHGRQVSATSVAPDRQA